MIRRAQVIGAICKKAGIRRERQEQDSFTKRELHQLNAHLDVVHARLEELEKERGEDNGREGVATN